MSEMAAPVALASREIEALTPRPSSRRNASGRVITVSLAISWPATAPPTVDDLPALRRFLEAVRDMAGAGVTTRIDGQVPMLEDVIARGFPDPQGRATATSLREVERAMLVRALEQHAGNRTHAAVQLGVTVRTVRNMIRRYKVRISPPRVQVITRRLTP